MKNINYFITLLTFGLISNTIAQEAPKWSYDIGLSFFKTSLKNQPNELLFNPVFEKWEAINHQPVNYSVSDYKALDPYPFNLSIGIDGLFRYKKYFMIKVGYNYTNTLGIGGTGNITYIDISSNQEIVEEKGMRYSSHQFTYFFGPLLPIGSEGAEVFMGFSMMSPTFVSYQEEYYRSEAGIIAEDYTKTFTGFFGNCRSIIGIQVPLNTKIKFGSELVFSYLNGLELKSGDIADEGFTFPDMQWHFTFRYELQ